ncbi:OmpH family outer membrane protein [Chitinophaga deserti]|uniref:OmpH family outer membrane protein n=1 Tax=Chitinophaga deserti TaxID=2164099 RepID=UPI000D6AB52C|nr:OmpH family outer membrane protein [Chitinophaga deserti]
MKKYVIIAIVAFTGFCSVKANAQTKIAHINAQALIESMPEYKKAQTDIEAYAATLEKESGALVAEYNKKMKDFENAPKDESDAMKAVKVKEIQDIQKRLQDYEQVAREKIGQKQGDLLKPVYDKARKAIEDVAKEKGYGYVIDNSGGTLLVSPAGDDILNTVKTKLGVSTTAAPAAAK